MRDRVRAATERDRIDARFRCEVSWVNADGEAHVIGYGEGESELSAVAQALRTALAFLES